MQFIIIMKESYISLVCSLIRKAVNITFYTQELVKIKKIDVVPVTLLKSQSLSN